MIKWALFGGLLAVLGYSGWGVGGLVQGIVAVGIGLLVLAIALEIAAAGLERIARRWGGMFHHHGNSVRMERSETAS